MTQQSILRIITINSNEEAVIRVNSSLPITLDFNGMSITLSFKDGCISQKIEPNECLTEMDEEDEVDLGPLVETQPLLESPESVHVTTRKSKSCGYTDAELAAIQDFQQCFMDGDTQIDL